MILTGITVSERASKKKRRPLEKVDDTLLSRITVTAFISVLIICSLVGCDTRQESVPRVLRGLYDEIQAASHKTDGIIESDGDFEEGASAADLKPIIEELSEYQQVSSRYLSGSRLDDGRKLNKAERQLAKAIDELALLTIGQLQVLVSLSERSAYDGPLPSGVSVRNSEFPYEFEKDGERVSIVDLEYLLAGERFEKAIEISDQLEKM